LTPVLNDEGKIGRFFITSVAALEKAELLCTVVLDTGTGTIIPLQALVPRIFTGPWADSLKYCLLDNA
jgi:hypothetical protein